MKTILAYLSFMFLTNAYAKSDYVVVDAITKPIYAQRYNKVKIETLHYISLTNPTNKVLGWQITYSLCTEKGCIEKKDTRNIEPHANIQIKEPLEAYTSYTERGQFKYWGKTKAIGDIKEYSDEATVQNYINVTD